jgi:hypothetical protein
MGYVYAVRGWLELSWPDADFEGVDESPEEHAEKIRRIREYVTVTLTPEQLTEEGVDRSEQYKAGWSLPQHALEGTEYLFYGADIEEPKEVLAQIRHILSLDPYADGYFSIEGEDGEQYRQWIIKSGKIYTRRLLFPDFDQEGMPQGYVPLSASW